MTSNSIARLDAYLESWRERLKRLRYATAAAAIAVAVLLLSVAGVYFAMRQGFTAWVVNTARALLLLAMVTLVLSLLVWPLKKLKSLATREIESRAPGFDGRLEAFLKAREQHNPLTDLLAEDTLKIAAAQSPEDTIKPRNLQLLWTLAGASIITLLWLAIAGPGLWSYGTRYLWAGWAVSNLKPAQSIVVNPGDQIVRRGGNVPVLATMQGFTPGDAEMHVQLSDGQWQQVPMTRTDEGFAFTFFSVREPMKYYVASAGVRSADYQVNVIDLPNINNLKLTYTYPQWTGRQPDVQDPGGDVTALQGTHIDLEVTADGPLPKTELVLDKKSLPVNTEAQFGKANFDVNADGRYYLAARVGNEQVRLSDDYFIRVTQDGKPEVHIQRPGHDYGASSIEEVTAHVDASDDYGLNAVELRYSVNGGKWQAVNLPAQRQIVSDDHTFSLESFGESKSPLQPGDVISYYAVAKDHSSTVRTDMFFIDVRPFDRRYSQSQEAGGQGGGMSGSDQGEISQRQREIIVSTWNLIREQSDKSSDGAKIEDNSKLLSELETKLAAQASALARRMQARDMDSSDAQSKEFSENIKQAIAAMQPAAKRLNNVELDEAIQPEQQALQYLLRAESVFNDIQVQQRNAQNGGGGGGGTKDSRDLAQLYELEMDLNKNQYETKSSASPERQQESNDELERKLQELARRQQQLANAAKQQQLNQEQRWQQESLRREAEELKRRIEQQQMQAANQQGSQTGSQQSSGQQGGQAQSGGQSGSQATQANASQSNELKQRLESAIRAMDESSQAIRNSSDANERARAQRATAEAQRQLSGASDAVSRGRQQAQQQQLANLANESSHLYEQQARFDRGLQDIVRKLRPQQNDNRVVEELSPEEKQLAQDKRAIADKLQDLRRDMINAQRGLKEVAPQAATDIASATQTLEDNKVDQRVATAVRYIENGGAPFVVASESAVTDGLRQVRDQLQRAASQAVGGTKRDDKTDDAVAEVRALRQQLEQMANRQRGQTGNAQPGNTNGTQASSQNGNNANGQAGGASNGQASSGNAQANANAGANVQGSMQPGSMTAGGGGAVNNGNAAWVGTSTTNGPTTASNMPAHFRGDLTNAIRDARAAINELNARGQLNPRDSQQLQDLTRQLEAARIGDNTARSVNADSIESLALLEQLELKLTRASEQNDKNKQGVRSAANEPVPQDYEDAVAEYYRRLSKD